MPDTNASTVQPDILGDGLVCEQIHCQPDEEGSVVATLISRPAPVSGTKAVLYVHGYVDYFFQTHLADFYNQAGFNFYALDLRKYGRSLLAHQTPNFCQSIEEYFEELDEAIRRIRERDGNTFLLLNGHSTGGLTTGLYAHERRHTATIDALFHNSPFYSFHESWFTRAAGIPLLAAQGLKSPRTPAPGGLTNVYAQSVHRDFFGEWDFNTDWKPIDGFPTYCGWIRAIHLAQKKLQAGLAISCPCLVMRSSRSIKISKSYEPAAGPMSLHVYREWPARAMREDAVLNVEHIQQFAPWIGADVTEIAIPGGMHDLILSERKVREHVFAHLGVWLARE